MKKVFIGFLLFLVGFFFVHKYKETSMNHNTATRSISSIDASDQANIDAITQKIIDEIKPFKNQGSQSKNYVATANNIEKVLKEILRDYGPTAVEKEQRGTLIYLAIIKLIPQLRSILWRMRHIVEEADYFHVSALSYLRNLKYWEYVYGPHVSAFFDYVTQPTDPSKPMFTSIRQFQETLVHLADSLTYTTAKEGQANSLLTQMNIVWENPNMNPDFLLDRRIFIGGIDGATNPNASGIRFLDPKEQKKRFIKPYLRGLQAVFERTAGVIYFTSTLHLEGLTELLKLLTKKSAINMIKGKFKLAGRHVSKGLSPEMIFESISDIAKKKRSDGTSRRKHHFLDMIEKRTAQKRLDKAHYLFKEAAQHELESYVCGITHVYNLKRNSEANVDPTQCLKFPNVNDDYHVPDQFAKTFILHSNLMGVNQKIKYDNLRNLYNLYWEEDSPITSLATGETIRVNIDSLFKYRESLTEFLPTYYSTTQDNYGFEDAVKAKGKEFKEKQWHWNYNWGKPVMWKADVWREIFPDIKGDGFGDKKGSVYFALRTMMLTDSLNGFGALITAP